MKEDVIRRAIGNINDELISDADKAQKNGFFNTPWKKWGSLAAVLILAAAIGTFVLIKKQNGIYPIITIEKQGDSEKRNDTIACRIDDAMDVSYADFAAAIVSGGEVYNPDYPSFKVKPKDMFSDTFIPFDIVFPYEIGFTYSVYIVPEKNVYEYITFGGYVDDYILRPFQFRKSEIGSSFSNMNINLDCTDVEGKANSIPYLKRSYTAHCYEIDKELHEHRSLYMICGDSIYRVDVHPSYLDKYDIFSDEYIDRVTSYIRDNIAPKTGGLKEYDPEKSFLEIYDEATAK